MRWRLGLMMAVVMTSGAGGRAETLSPARAAELTAQALRSYDQAVTAAQTDSAAAKALYRDAIAAMTTLTDAGVRNAALEYNLGNANYRVGDLGRAILHYRRAARLAPTDADVRANLDYARRRVEPYLESDQTRRAFENLLIWKRLTRPTQWWLAVALGVIGWGLLAIRLRVRSAALFSAGAIGAAAALVLVSSLAADLRRESYTPDAVIVDQPQILRRGRGEAYEPVVKQALGPGVEVRILDQRPDWVRVRLVTGESGWAPATSLERI